MVLAMLARAFASLLLLIVSFATGCSRTEAGSPERVADAFADAYFREADQVKAKQFTAFGASKMLDDEIAETRGLRGSDFKPADADLNLTMVRDARSTRGERVRFDYVLRFKGAPEKHADVELSKVADEWKVVRVTVGDAPAPATS